MAIFNSYVSHYQRVSSLAIPPSLSDLATKPEEFSVRFDETEESTHEQMQCHRDFQESIFAGWYFGKVIYYLY